MEIKDREIQHESHEHPLVLVEAHQSKRVICSGCRGMVYGPSLSCMKCNYYLHKQCAETPLEIYNHPLLLHHQYLKHDNNLELRTHSRSFKWYGCHLCKENRNMFVYRCLCCHFYLDINCAFASRDILGETFQKFKLYAHQHPLILIENHKDELKRGCCSWCQKQLVDSIYVCFDCKFYLHKKCVNLPFEINHPCHRKHHLVLKSDDNIHHFCKFCHENKIGYFYSCSRCVFDIDIECVQQKLSIEDNYCHEHPLTLFWRQDSFLCNACGMEGNYVSYICSICHFQIHKKCISLPRIIKLTRHSHPLLHYYSLMEMEFGNQDCGICFDQVKIEHGCYYCFKGDCKYIVHVNCVLENYKLYYIIDQLNQNENLAMLINNPIDQSCITSVIEKNEFGEATKIKHLLHKHDLILVDKFLREDHDKVCDGCMLFISTSFYYCSECDFFLHKACAELPEKKYNWFHLFSTTLTSYFYFECDKCFRQCSGFCYESDERYIYFCLRCSTLQDTLKCQAHNHLLFFDIKFRGQCNACGVATRGGAYRCKDCEFAVDFHCITLPHSTWHKSDGHLLRLTFHDDNDYPEEHYCDICEEKRDPNHWFYHCAICDTSVHPKCVLGKYPFMKSGRTYMFNFHPHPLTIVKEMYDYPKCLICGKTCQDLALKCEESTCNYVNHWQCVFNKYIALL